MRWDLLPVYMRNEYVKAYYDILKNKEKELQIKRAMDIVLSLVLIILLSPAMILIAVLVATTSKGGAIYKQKRVTKNAKVFNIYKFRTMYQDSDKQGRITLKDDDRVTKVGKVLRKYRLDEFPQLFNILFGDMSFVGTRPEVIEYVKKYDKKMLATLLMPAGLTSEASIKFKDEDKLMDNASDRDYVYINKVLPIKMKYNLYYLKKFSIWRDIYIMMDTVYSVIFK